MQDTKSSSDRIVYHWRRLRNRHARARFYAFNHAAASALKGWVIPAVTDVAFTLGIIMILGKIVPASLKFFRDAIIHRRRLRDFDNGNILRRISLGDVIYGCCSGCFGAFGFKFSRRKT